MKHSFLGLERPIIQAPMAGVQDHCLAIAVSNAGGLGSLPCGMLNPKQINQEIEIIKTETAKPFNVNFFCHQNPTVDLERDKRWQKILQPYYNEYSINANQLSQTNQRVPFNAELADIVIKHQPKFVSFHFGLPNQALLSKIKSSGIKILSSATTIEEAIWLERNGTDIIIAQGLEAGGHRGMFLSQDLTTQMGIFALLPQIIKAVNIPVIAAGGIADAQGVKAVLSIGAIAAQVGTAYLLCPESKTSHLHRQAIKSQASIHTAITNIYSGRPARGIVNRAIKEIGPINTSAPEFPLASNLMSPLRKAAESCNLDSFTPLWCGQNTTGSLELPAAEVTKKLAARN
jgi:nitronate monooxygenase